jgi:hypothetical protein
VWDLVVALANDVGGGASCGGFGLDPDCFHLSLVLRLVLRLDCCLGFWDLYLGRILWNVLFLLRYPMKCGRLLIGSIGKTSMDGSVASSSFLLGFGDAEGPGSGNTSGPFYSLEPGRFSFAARRKNSASGHCHMCLPLCPSVAGGVILGFGTVRKEWRNSCC